MRRADVVFSFCHQAPNGLRPDRSGRLRIFYFCTTTHNALVKACAEPLETIANTPNNFIFVLNHSMRNSFETAGIVCHVWNHGVDLNVFFPRKRPRTDHITFGFVGQVGNFKRRGFLVECFVDAFGQQPNQAQLLVLTGGNSLPGITKLPHNIQLVAKRPHAELAEFYRRLDCLVTFSWAEGYNMPLLEALACGVPCIVPDMPEMHEDPYDILCQHVPTRRVINPEVLLGTHFAPRQIDLYFTPPWVHDVDREAAVTALRAFKPENKISGIDQRHTWLGRIQGQFLPVVEPALRAIIEAPQR